ncbi:ABC transporter permease [Solibacillus silvestris]|uniref:ABC transporter permease n=1 Tax=Solibacillus silvestris TaxID=76853 RepID=UPI003F7F3F7F
MFFKIAVNNVKRSFKDYSIYFLTLTLGVCIFYSFNSIEAQNTILEMNKDPNVILTLNKLMAGTSVFVSVVLGALIIYANNFLIKKRKKELGIYMTLGMPKGTISKILLFETLFIGVLSLVVGLGLGIIVSQGMSVITANILGFDLNRFKFIISFGAMMKTVLYFGIIYLIVMIFNQMTISKYKLIDMLNAAKKNEVVKVKNSFVSLLLFLLAVGLLATAYTRILKSGINAEAGELIVTVMLGVIGTLFFFFSLSSFFIQLVQKNKKIYLKDINIFVLRQINNKVNTNFLSMTVICLMLFLTISLLFTAFDLKGSIQKGTKTFDASASVFVDVKREDPQDNEMEEFLNRIDFTFEPYEKHAFYREYKLDVTPEDLLASYLTEQERSNLEGSLYYNDSIFAIKFSDYKAMMEIQGQKAVELKENEVLVVTNPRGEERNFSNETGRERIVYIGDSAYTIKNESPLEAAVNVAIYEQLFYLIIPDSFSESMQLEHTGFNVVYDEKYFEKSEKKFADVFNKLEADQYRDVFPALVIGRTLVQVQDRENGAIALVVFIGLFLGLIFIITSAAVLALQQLSDASDSLERYKSLKKIGVTENLINKAILSQTLIYFMVPLSLAILHSIIGISAVREIFNFDYQSIAVSVLFLAIVYGGYFYATYIGIKNIVKNSN